MTKKILMSVVVLVCLALAMVVLLGATGERKATVTSEPLPCFTQGDTLMCFDAAPGSVMKCERLTAHDILCSGQPDAASPHHS